MAISGRIIMLTQRQYNAAVYALHSAWDRINQGMNNEDEQHYEVPLDRAKFDAEIVRRCEREEKKGTLSDLHRHGLAILEPAYFEQSTKSEDWKDA